VAFRDAVDSAMYWQPPDGTDQALSSAAAREELMPTAQAVLASPAAR
jgi:hypothetical protein